MAQQIAVSTSYMGLLIMYKLNAKLRKKRRAKRIWMHEWLRRRDDPEQQRTTMLHLYKEFLTEQEFANMVNPAAVAWYLPVSATEVWTKEQLKQQITYVNGITALDLQDCGLTEIPENVYTLDELPNINVLELSGNFIRTLPKRLSCIELLKELRLCYNEVREIETGALGKQLEVLSLNHNRLKCLPTHFSSCLQLRFLNLAYNDLEQLPPALPVLEVLDVSENNTLGDNSTLVSARSGTSTLDQQTGFSKLIMFYASECAYTKIPESILASQTVKCINMTSNELHALSPDIGNLSDLIELFLDYNEIQQLPTELINCRALRDIHIHRNPLDIPQEVIFQGVKAIMNYLKESENASAVNMRFRVPMLGDTGTGKSSFVDSLIAGEPLLKHEDDRTYVIEHKQWTPESKRYPGKKLQIQFDDFGGHECYKQVHVFFLSRKCTPVICVHVDKLNEKTFDDVVTPWLEATSSTIPNATFHVLITQTDHLPDEQAVKNKEQMALKKIRKHEESVKEQIKKDMDRVKRDVESCDDYAALQKLNERIGTLEKFLSQRPEVPNKIHAVCANDIKTVKSVGQEICNVFEDIRKYPKEKVPIVWKTFLTKIKAEPGLDMYLTWNKICQLGGKCGLNEESVSYALKYLHLCGDVLWYHDGPMLKDIVFHDLNKVVDLIRSLITHDIKDIKKDPIKFSRLTDDQFVKDKERMLTKGLISSRFLDCLLQNFRLRENETDIVKELLLRFDLCFAIPRADNVYDAKQAVELMFPWLLPVERPHNVLDEKPRGSEKQIGIRMCFAGLCPASFFPALSVRLNKFLQREGDNRQDWSTGVFGKDESGNIFLLEHMRWNGRDTLQLKVRGTDLGAMWHLALPIQREMQELLNKWPGVISIFYVPCPRCPMDKVPPCNFTADYLWQPYPDLLEQRCPKDMERVQKLLLYPSRQVLEGIRPLSKQVSTGKGHTNYQKLWTLLNGYGAEMLREILQALIQPQSLNQWLLSYQPTVHRILKNRPLKTYGRLYPLSVRAVELYDLSCDLLLDLLMGDLKGVHQNKIFIEDFKRVQDNLNDRSSQTLSDENFEQLWKKAETAIVHLGGKKEKIAEIKDR